MAKLALNQRTVIPGVAELAAEFGGALEQLVSVEEFVGSGVGAHLLERLNDEVDACAATRALGAGAGR